MPFIYMIETAGGQVMKNDLISIGKMAEISRLTVPALRFYDRLDLLKPAWTDPETGYRYYHVGQNARLDMISYMKELGMSLSEIADILKGMSLRSLSLNRICNELRYFLVKKVGKVTFVEKWF